MANVHLIDNQGFFLKTVDSTSEEIEFGNYVIAPLITALPGQQLKWNLALKRWVSTARTTAITYSQSGALVSPDPTEIIRASHIKSSRKKTRILTTSGAVRIPTWATNGFSRVRVSAIGGGAFSSAGSTTAGMPGAMSRVPVIIPRGTRYVEVSVGAPALREARAGSTTKVTVGKNIFEIPGAPGPNTTAANVKINGHSVQSPDTTSGTSTLYNRGSNVGEGFFNSSSTGNPSVTTDANTYFGAMAALVSVSGFNSPRYTFTDFTHFGEPGRGGFVILEFEEVSE